MPVDKLATNWNTISPEKKEPQSTTRAKKMFQDEGQPPENKRKRKQRMNEMAKLECLQVPQDIVAGRPDVMPFL